MTCFTAHLETCDEEVPGFYFDAVAPPLHQIHRSLADGASSDAKGGGGGRKKKRKNEASTAGQERHASPCMRSCEPGGRKQQRITVRKLLPLVKK